MSCCSNNNETRFYTYDEVCIHNKPCDFWVVIHGHILDLTPMIQDRKDNWNANLQYLIGFGGKDISRYFFKTGYPKTEISPKTGRPRVLFPPIRETAHSDRCKTPAAKCRYAKIWSLDPMYHIGKITCLERRLRVINTLTGKTHHMKVCEEDTLDTVLQKYKNIYNSHAGSYTWRKDYKNGSVSGRIDFNKTLTDNGLVQEKDGIGPPPAIWLFYNDDFSIA